MKKQSAFVIFGIANGPATLSTVCAVRRTDNSMPERRADNHGAPFHFMTTLSSSFRHKAVKHQSRFFKGKKLRENFRRKCQKTVDNRVRK